MLPDSVESIIINTGNIINSKELKKKALQSPSEEVCDSVIGSFHSYINSITSHQLASDLKSVYCDNDQSSKVINSDRAELKVSVKIFLDTYTPETLRSSILQVMEAIDVQIIDSVILSLSAFHAEDIKPLWTELENCVQEGKIVTIGISDLDTPELAALYKMAQIKPSANQVNLESCCVMPTEMVAFAKENDIQLLTHNDPKVLLPQKMLYKILEPGVKNPEDWKTQWIVRYSVVFKCRGIIQNKGYLLCAIKR